MARFILIFPIIIVLIGVILSFYSQYLTQILNYLTGDKSSISGKLFTSAELLQYNGIDKPELYLAILGNVFNVTKGGKHYGPGGTYNVFVGRDASRSFITGQFSTSEVSDDVVGLKKQELLSLNNWLQFYKRDYIKIGKLMGRYYDKNGKPTQYCREIKKLIKLAEGEKDLEEIEKLKFPPCNIEWSAEHGSRVWCTRRSGGIERNWVGFPRKLYEPGSDSYRCACISDENRNLGNIKEYEDCNPNFDSCYVKA